MTNRDSVQPKARYPAGVRLSRPQSTYTAVYVHALVDVLRRYDIGVSELIAASGVDPGEVDWSDPLSRVSHPVLVCLYNTAVHLTGQESIGLDVGMAVTPASLHALGLALRSAENLGEALQLNLRYQPLILGPGELALSRDGNYSTLSWTPLVTGSVMMRPLNDAVLSAWLHFGQSFTGKTGLYPASISFSHPQPADLQPYRQLFRCSMEFNADSNRVVFPTRLLQLPLHQRDNALKQLMVKQLEQIDALSQRPEQLAQQVEQWIDSQMEDSGDLSIGKLALHLHCSERTLRRRLQDEGLGYREMVAAHKLAKAKTLLEQGGGVSLGRIAFACGFKSQSAFSQAFLRWTGMAPSRYRCVSGGSGEGSG